MAAVDTENTITFWNIETTKKILELDFAYSNLIKNIILTSVNDNGGGNCTVYVFTIHTLDPDVSGTSNLIGKKLNVVKNTTASAEPITIAESVQQIESIVPTSQGIFCLTLTNDTVYQLHKCECKSNSLELVESKRISFTVFGSQLNLVDVGEKFLVLFGQMKLFVLTKNSKNDWRLFRQFTLIIDDMLHLTIKNVFLFNHSWLNGFLEADNDEKRAFIVIYDKEVRMIQWE